MTQRKRIYEGKAKILYKGPRPNTLVQHFKDDLTAFNNQKKSKLGGKGVLNNRISAALFERLERIGVRTHFIKSLNMREQLIYEVDILPLEVVVRNIAAGSLVKRLGLENGSPLPAPVIEFYYKKDALGDPMVSESHILSFDWATPRELEFIEAVATRVNDYLRGLFSGLGIRLVDFKMEFGRYWDNEEAQILLADEISPDTCRLWDTTDTRSYDKDVFRFDKGDVLSAYQEVARRLDVLPTSAIKQGARGPHLVRSK